MVRVAIYAWEAPGRRGATSLARQVGRLAGEVARRPGWCHVATYSDCCEAWRAERPGLWRLLAEAPGRIDVVVVDGYGRLSVDRRALDALAAHLHAVGVQVAALRPSAGRRVAKVLANLALADLIGEAAR